MSVKPVPEGMHTVTPYLLAKGADKLIDFLKAAFNAQVMFRHAAPNGAILHAQVKIGDSIVMLSEPPPTHTPSPAMLYLYVPDVAAVYKCAVAAGGVSIMEPRDMFYGDRSGAVKDMFDNQWWIATHIEDVSEEELTRRSAESMKKGSCG